MLKKILLSILLSLSSLTVCAHIPAVGYILKGTGFSIAGCLVSAPFACSQAILEKIENCEEASTLDCIQDGIQSCYTQSGTICIQSMCSFGTVYTIFSQQVIQSES